MQVTLAKYCDCTRWISNAYKSLNPSSTLLKKNYSDFSLGSDNLNAKEFI